MPQWHMSDEAVWARVDKLSSASGCWLWTGHKSNTYGTCKREGKTTYVHRLVWSLTTGQPIPGFTVVFMHTCDTPLCCNPAHIRLGTRRENAQDRNNKQRQARGSKMGSSKLHETQIAEIRRRYDSGESQDRIARTMGVTRVAIHNVVTRKTWMHVA